MLASLAIRRYSSFPSDPKNTVGWKGEVLEILSRFWHVGVSKQPRKVRGVMKVGALLSLVEPTGLGRHGLLPARGEQMAGNSPTLSLDSFL